MIMAARRSHAPAMRAPLRDTLIAIAPPRFSVSSKASGRSDEAFRVGQADRQARRQGDADPAAALFLVDRLSGTQWRRRSARDGRLFRWMAYGAHRYTAGTSLSGIDCGHGAG